MVRTPAFQAENPGSIPGRVKILDWKTRSIICIVAVVRNSNPAVFGGKTMTAPVLDGTTLVVPGVVRKELPARSVILFNHFNDRRGQLIRDESVAEVLRKCNFAHTSGVVTDAMERLRDAFHEIGRGHYWIRERGRGWTYKPPGDVPNSQQAGPVSDGEFTPATPVKPGAGHRRSRFDFPAPDFSVLRESQPAKSAR